MPLNRVRRVALASLFGGLILVAIGFLPPPTGDYLIIVEAFFLSLSYLVVGRGGATYSGIVAGILLGIVQPAFFVVNIVFASQYGILVDATCLGLGAKRENVARTSRMMVAVTISTAIVGFGAYYVTAVMTNLVPNQAGLDASILVFGIISGVIAGFLAARVWNRYLRSRF